MNAALKSSLISSGFSRPSISPFSDSVMRPQEDVRTFATLSGSLEFFGDLLLGFHPNGHPHLLFKFLTKLHPRAEAPVIA